MIDQLPEDPVRHLPVTRAGSPGFLPESRHIASPAYGTELESAHDWPRFFAAVMRHKWLVALCTLLGAGAAVAAVRFTGPVFQTEATVWINADAGGDTGPIRQAQLLQNLDWVDLLKSYVVVEEAVRELRLHVGFAPQDSMLFRTFRLQDRFVPGDYELGLSALGDTVTLMRDANILVGKAAAGDSIGQPVGFGWRPDITRLHRGRAVKFSVSPPRDRAQQLARDLHAGVDRNSRFLAVSLSGINPQEIAATVNVVLRRFVEVAGELASRGLAERAAALRDQLRNAEQNLRNAERQLQDYQVRTITLPAERAVEAPRDPVIGSFFDVRVELDGLHRDRESLARGLAQATESGVRVEAFETIESVRSSTELVQALGELTDKRADLRALQYRYTDAFPPVRRLVDEIRDVEERTIPQLVRALDAELGARERQLQARAQLFENEMRQIPQRRIEGDRLARDVDIAETLYTNLQRRFEEARLAELSRVPDVRILEAAVVPQRPTRNRTPVIFMIGILSGMGIGVVGAVVLDRFDRSVRYPQQVADQMGLPILGIIPHMRGIRNGRRTGDSSPVVEALRGVRLNLVHAYGSAGPVVVTVTSPGAGDGKSFVASNLALAFADAGHRTLLIDGDSRRGSLHRVFAASRKPGLLDCLAGRAQADAAVQKTEYPLLHFLGGGTRMSGAPELLGSPQMVQLLTAFRSSYAVIIIDSPPLGAGVDAFTLGTISGNMIIVFKTGATDRDESEAKLDLLDRLPVRILGAILNGVKDQKAYGYKYYSYYMPGYEYEVEEEGRLLEGAE